MRVFYHLCGKRSDVPSDSPVEASEREALILLNGLRGQNAFLGLELKDDYVLQFMYQQGAFRTEILNRTLRSLEFCTLSLPLAEESIRAASRGQPIQQIAEDACLKWEHEELA